MTSPEPPPPQGSWIRRNLLPLTVLAVAVPALAFVLIGLPILENAAGEARFQIVQPGDTVQSGGYALTLITAGEMVGLGAGSDSNDIPLGSSLVSAIVKIAPNPSGTADGAFCSTELTSRAFGAERYWGEISNLGTFGYSRAENRSSYCDLEGEPLTLEVVFLTPTGTYDEATLDVSMGDDRLRFELVR